MNGPPPYFESTRLRAAQMWDQLERRPDLAGPWHQLFKQVQQPRHVLSELLQNADDARATEASVKVEDQVFHFEHNGEDFVEPHFESLCRFGYSNKRELHTIGFRGVGFKSTFSLGDRVELITPTLSVGFHRNRFTEPCWISQQLRVDDRTCIRVAISDQHRLREIERNLEEWTKSPVSLLFFRHIRRIRVGNCDLHWKSLGPGPISDSERLVLRDKKSSEYLHIRSEPKAFPNDALNEIRQERLIGVDDETEFPPCKVEIVLGAKGRLYVVLPTGVDVNLPFACNAPFIQDPARMKIKEPETSPTNRWLLKRVGKLTASAMLSWLENTQQSVEDRAQAYGLLPSANRHDSSLEGVCGAIVEEAFGASIEGRDLLLSDEGQLTASNECVIVPNPISGVWPHERVASFFDEDGRPALDRHVRGAARQKLLRWGVIEEISKEKIIETLQHKPLPKPEQWAQLLELWSYVKPEVTGYYCQIDAKEVNIVPILGTETLHAASEVVRLGEKKLLQSEEDWEFLSAHMMVMNQDWPRYLVKYRRSAQDQQHQDSLRNAEAAFALLKAMDLAEANDVSRVTEQVAAKFFAQRGVSLNESVRLTQIAAKLEAKAGASFKCITRDGQLTSIIENILVDDDGTLEELVPKQDRESHLLHSDYTNNFTSCTKAEWQSWIFSGRSGLLSCVPLKQKRTRTSGRWHITQEARKRGLDYDLHIFPYVTDDFRVEDWDFESHYWRFWETITEDDPRLWNRVAERILSQPESFWGPAQKCRLFQVATTGNRRLLDTEPLLPSWALRLREIACLPDTRGFLRKPGELLRRTSATEAHIDLEPFIDIRLDQETTRPLLDLLGVRNTPTGPDRLLDCLRALAQASSPPQHEVEKWYRRLDQMVMTCSSADFKNIRDTFRSEKLVLTQDCTWETANAVFLSSGDEDVPGVSVIRSAVEDLTLWTKIGVADRPTPDLIIEWLKSLQSGQALSQNDAPRVRALLGRYPFRIWEECQHWLNLAGGWTPVNELSYAMTMQSLFPWRHLHQWVKQKTADFQRLTTEVVSATPFSNLMMLADAVENRFHQQPQFARQPERQEWLGTVGEVLRRVELDTEEDTRRARILADKLASTSWQTSSGLEIIPYIDGTPAGTPRKADVIWLGRALYVDDIPKAKLAKRVPEEIGKSFGRADIKAALDYSFDRSPSEVRQYLEENFRLVPAEALGTVEDPAEQNQENKSTIPSLDTDTEGPSDESTTDGPDSESPEVGQPDIGDDQLDDQQDNSDQDSEGDDYGQRPRKRTRSAPPPPSIIERFARAQGFGGANGERYSHKNGYWIGRTGDGVFPWAMRKASGEVIRFYWPKDHCLEHEPLQLEADVWFLLDRHPDTHALVLSSGEGSPIEVTGANVRAMLEQGRVTVYPATYRLVFEDNNRA